MFMRKTQPQKHEVSIDEPLNIDWDGNELLLSDILGTDADCINRPIEQAIERDVLLETVGRLGEPRTADHAAAFRPDDGQERTQKEVADIIGISQSYISRLEKRIVKRLKKELEANFIATPSHQQDAGIFRRPFCVPAIRRFPAQLLFDVQAAQVVCGGSFPAGGRRRNRTAPPPARPPRCGPSQTCCGKAAPRRP
jgi:hypothetical protein